MGEREERGEGRREERGRGEREKERGRRGKAKQTDAGLDAAVLNDSIALLLNRTVPCPLASKYTPTSYSRALLCTYLTPVSAQDTGTHWGEGGTKLNKTFPHSVNYQCFLQVGGGATIGVSCLDYPKAKVTFQYRQLL